MATPKVVVRRSPWKVMAIGLVGVPFVLLVVDYVWGVAGLFDRIIEVAQTGIAILMVEQNAKQALGVADRGYVLVDGSNRHTGTGQELREDPEVARMFLGARD